MSDTVAVVDETDDESTEGESLPPPRPCLIFVFDRSRPLAASQLISLVGKRTVSLRRKAAEAPLAGPDEAIIEIDHSSVSARHATLREDFGRWILQDDDSSKGTHVDGVKVERCVLRDGAVIEIQGAFFVFRESEPAEGAHGLATFNPHYSQSLRSLALVARTRHPILVLGESGTGKEIVAREIHRLSKRRGAFQPINCAALAESVAHSELFGARKGAYTGSTADRAGFVQGAHEGTLFLDEIGDLAFPLQGMFLRSLQELEVTPLGTHRATPVDFRVIAATHRDLEGMVAAGKFRADFLSRINHFVIKLPPLRDRPEDLGTLIAALLRRHGDDLAEPRFSLKAARALFQFRWALNVRELERALAIAIVRCEGGRIELHHLPPALAEPEPPKPAPRAKARSPRHEELCEQLVAALTEHRGNVAAVARAFNKQRAQIHRWMHYCGLNPDDFR